ncbi:MAG TPA: hypothetical protein VN958_17600 [Chitinophagaceae bacterium]|nr:hypothetical protein [Chitinophagaceae bacterium]
MPPVYDMADHPFLDKDSPLNIMLFGISPSHGDAGEMQKMVMEFTDAMDMFSFDLYGVKIPVQKLRLFEHFYAFDSYVWICTFISMIILGLIQATMRGEIKKTFGEVFQYLMLLMTEVMTKSYKNSSIRLLNASWFLFATVFLSAFAGVMFNFMTKGIEYNTIRNLKDLMRPEFSHLKIHVMEFSTPHQHFMEDNNEITTALLPRVVVREGSLKSYNMKNIKPIINSVLERKAVFIDERQICLYHFNKLAKKDNMVYKASEISWVFPVFLPVKRTTTDLNLVIQIYNKVCVYFFIFLSIFYKKLITCYI